MDAFKCLLFLFLFVFKTFDDVNGGCILSLQKDFGNPSPVFVRNHAFLAPDATGAISLKRSEVILASCPGAKRLIVLGNVTSSYDTLEAHCIDNVTFRVDRWVGAFKDIRCTSHPYFITRNTARECNGRATVYEVGYQIKSKFYRLYEACFNGDLLNTLYVKHNISPSSLFMQTGSRPAFTEGSLFNKVRMSKIYKVDNQRNRLDAILGSNMSAVYITKKQFLTRGHLAARADFTLKAESRATFHYVNAAPQWQRGNAGDWAALEDALRRRVQALGRTVTVHTGTHRVMSLADRKKKSLPIYLHTDENNNEQVPVPLYFYKLVHDPKDKTATAFVLINSSYYNASMIGDLSFCRDVCDGNSKFSWLKWRSNDGTHSFCCDYKEFSDEVHYLKGMDITGLFY